MTSLYALQSSLAVLRTHRPEFFPRTGFVWPITDSSISDEANKRKTADDESSDTGRSSPDSLPDKTKPATAEGPKRLQNVGLLFEAMRATAKHSKLALSSNFTQNTESLNPEYVSEAPTQDPNTKSSSDAQDSAPKAAGGKKKRKRTLQAS